MRDWLIGLGIAVAGVLASWGLLIVLAKRLPSGILRDLASFIPDCVTTVRRLRKDPRVPRRAKIVIIIAGIWGASPIDLIPSSSRSSAHSTTSSWLRWPCATPGRQVPRDVLVAAWPGEPRLLERLLGPTGAEAIVGHVTCFQATGWPVGAFGVRVPRTAWVMSWPGGDVLQPVACGELAPGDRGVDVDAGLAGEDGGRDLGGKRHACGVAAAEDGDAVLA